MATNSVQRQDVINLIGAIADGMIASLDACTVTDAGLGMYRAAIQDYARALHKALGFDEATTIDDGEVERFLYPQGRKRD